MPEDRSTSLSLRVERVSADSDTLGPRLAHSARQTASLGLVLDLLVDMASELIDAHEDTVRLAAAQAPTEDWALHVHYLRDLQRACRSALAQAIESVG